MEVNNTWRHIIHGGTIDPIFMVNIPMPLSWKDGSQTLRFV